MRGLDESLSAAESNSALKVKSSGQDLEASCFCFMTVACNDRMSGMLDRAGNGRLHPKLLGKITRFQRGQHRRQLVVAQKRRLKVQS